MHARNWLGVIALGAALCHTVSAQAPSAAPAGSTGQCKDGTFSTAATKSGACRGHKGIQQWFTADASTAAKPSTTTSAAATTPAPAPTAKPAPMPAAQTPVAPAAPAAAAKASKPSAAMGTPAPGGGPGMVWVNNESKVYHCPGTKYYGLTKNGKYMTEAAAKTAGAHADHGNACTK